MLNLIGRGSVKEIGREAKGLLGSCAFIVASAGPVGESQAAGIAELLRAAGMASVSWCEAVPNPTAAVVHSGVDAFRASGCDLIVAVGGGSAIDTAKGVGLVASNGGHIRDYDGANKSKKPMPPFIAVSTTAGSGSEVTQFAVITDEEKHTKFTIVDWHMTPNVSVNDPEMMTSMPPSLTAATGMDALTHAIEAYVSTHASPVTDAKALKAVQLVGENLASAVRDGNNMDARENMCYASFLAGTAFNNAGLGLTHGMSHPLGGKYDLPHGLCNALLLPHIVRFNLNQASDKYSDLAVAMGAGKEWRSGVENGEALVRAIFALSREIGLPSGLAEIGVKSGDLPELSEEAMDEAIGATNPRPYTAPQVLELYKDAL